MRRFWIHIAAAASAGWFVGGLVGTAEFVHIARGSFPERSDLVAVAFGYSAYFFLGAIVIAMVRMLWPRGRKRPFGTLFVEYGALTMAGGILAFLAHKTNSYWLASPVAPSSIAANAGLALAAGAALWGLPRLAGHVPARAGSRALVLAAAAWIAAAGTALWPSREPSPSQAPPPTSARPPSTLVICVDTLRADHLGCYGYGRLTSPAIDKLAEEGVRFENCMAASSWTRPAVASILTGVLPAVHGQYRPDSALPRNAPMLPDAAGRYGYRTALISTNFLISRRAGFGQTVDRCAGRSYAAVFQTSVNYCLEHANRLYVKLFPRSRKPWGHRMFFNAVFRKLNEARIPAADRSPHDAAWANQRLLDWIDEDRARPFFAYVHYMEPHMPYDAPPPYGAMFQDPGYKGPELAEAPLPLDMETPIPPLARGMELPEDQRRYLIGRYDGEIRYVDDALARLFEALAARGLYDDMIIVVCADHGEEFYEHGAWYHRHSLFGEILRVPLIIKLPRARQAGSVVGTTVRQIDIVPTLLDLAGMEAWPVLQGSSLKPLMDGTDPVRAAAPALSDMYCQGNYVAALVDGRYKLIHIKARREVWLLYDLAADPGETRSLTAEEPQRAEAMRTAMTALLDSCRADRWREAARDLSPEEVRKLKSLGYIQ